MEIIQTIWTALITENELLATIVLLPETFLEATISMLIFTAILNISANKKTKICYVIVFSILTNLSNLLIPNPYRSCVNLLLVIFSIHFFFRPTILKTFLATIIPILLAVLCESIIIKLSFVLFNFNIKYITSYPLYRLLVAISVQILTYFIYLLIRYFKVHINILETMHKKERTLFLLNFIIALISIIIQFLITGFYLNVLPIYIVIFSNISLILYFILSIYSLTKSIDLQVTSINLEQEKETNRRLKEMQDELLAFRHDFSNILCTISGYIQVSDIQGLKKYYSEIQKDINKVNTLGALNPEIINNPAIFILISSKYSKALEENIEMNINIFLDLNTLNMKIYEFTRILGILLDNAIEAAKECNEKIINLEIIKDTNRNRQLLIIENTYMDKNINTEKIFEKKYSTKKGNSGLGLWEVKQILKRNNNLNLFTSKDNKFFKQQLEIYN